MVRILERFTLLLEIKEKVKSSNQKKRMQAGFTACLLVVLLIVSGVTKTADGAVGGDSDEVSETDISGSKAELSSEEVLSYEDADKDVILWYDDASFTAFFEQCAVSYYEECGIAVEPVYVDSLTYMEDIYDASMSSEDTSAPDLYLTWGDSLEKAVLYGIATEHAEESYWDDFPDIAKEASTYHDRVYGYPLTFTTPVFVYDTTGLSSAPDSIQQIIDIAAESELGNGLANLIEWDLNDGFYDIAFVGSALSFSETESGELDTVTDEDAYTQALTYMQSLSEIISLSTETISEEQVIVDFNEGATATAIIDARDMSKITLESAAFCVLPALNDSIPSQGFSNTAMLLVNEMTGSIYAEDFASYATNTYIRNTELDNGYYPACDRASDDVKESVAFLAYEKSKNVPASMDAANFWTQLERRVRQAWESGNVA